MRNFTNKILFILITFSVVLASKSQNNYFKDIDYFDSIKDYKKVIETGRTVLEEKSSLSQIGIAWMNYYIGKAYLNAFDINSEKVDSAVYFLMNAISTIEITDRKNVIYPLCTFTLVDYYGRKHDIKNLLFYAKKTATICEKYKHKILPHILSYKAIGLSYAKQLKPDSSMLAFQKALELNREIYRNREFEAEIYYWISINYDIGLDIPLNAALKSEQIYFELVGKYHPAYANVIHSFASLYNQYRDYRKSVNSCLQYLIIADSIGIDSNFMHILSTLTSGYEQLQKPDSALYFSNLGIEFIEKSEHQNFIYLGHFYSSKARSEKELNNYVLAKQSYTKAVEFYEKTGDTLWIIFGYNGIAAFINETNEAFVFYQKSLSISKLFYGENSPEVAQLYSDIGSTYCRIGNNKLAKECYLKSLELYYILKQNDRPQVAILYSEICEVEMRLHNWDSIPKYFKHLLNKLDPTKISNNELARIYFICGNYYSHLEDKLNSKKYFDLYIETVYKANYPEKFKMESIANAYSNIAFLYQRASDFEQSINFYLKSIEIYKQDSASNYINIGRQLELISIIYSDIGDYSSYLNFLFKARKFYLYNNPYGSTPEIKNSINIMNAYYSIGKIDSSNYYRDHALNLATQIYQENDCEIASILISIADKYSNIDTTISKLHIAENKLIKCNIDSLNLLGMCYSSLSYAYFNSQKLELAKKYSDLYFEIAIKLYGKNSNMIAGIYLQKGLRYLEFNQYDIAIKYLKVAESITVELYGENSLELGDIYLAISEAYINLNELNEFNFYLSKSEKIYSIHYVKSDIHFANILNSKARHDEKTFQNQKALEKYKKAYEIATTFYLTSPLKFVEYNSDLANSYINNGDYKSALKLYFYDLEVLEKYNQEFTYTYAITLNNIGNLYYRFDIKSAHEYFSKANKYFVKLHKTFSHEYIDNCKALCFTASLLGYKDIAYQYCDTALLVAKQFYSKNHIRLAYLYNAAGALCYNYEQLDWAENYYLQALDIFNKNGYFKGLLDSYINLGQLALSKGSLQAAEKYFTLSDKFSKKLNSNCTSFHLFELAKIKLLKQEWVNSLNFVQEGLNLEKKDFYLNLQIMNEGDRMERIKDYSLMLNFMASLSGHFQNDEIFSKQLYNSILFSKNALLNYSSNERRFSIKSEDTNGLELFIAKKELESKLSKMFEVSVEKRPNNFLDSLQNILNEVNRKIVLSIELNEGDAGIKEIHKKVESNEIIVEITRFRKTIFNNSKNESSYFSLSDSSFYVALILSKETEPKLLILNNGGDLDSTYILRYQQHLTNPKQREDKDWESYNYFWAAIDSAIGDKKVVYVSPDGVYNKINLQTFVTPDGKFLGDKYDLRIIGSSRDLLDTIVPINNKIKNALLVGNPNFNGSTTAIDSSLFAYLQPTTDAFNYTTRSFENTNISPLPSAEKEVNAISKLLTQYNYKTTTLTGTNAQESRIKTQGSPTILHIATHGYFASDLKKNTNERSMGINMQKVVENPMLRSGLLLAGAGSTIQGKYEPKEGSENGILTAYEVQNMNLDSTELVVLSACETGLGEVKNGEGVYGLQRAFRIAGAKTIIMSLWKVDDEATQLLMTSFYENWLSGKTKREAFKAAQNILMQNPRYNHPYYWGAFVITGE